MLKIGGASDTGFAGLRFNALLFEVSKIDLIPDYFFSSLSPKVWEKLLFYSGLYEGVICWVSALTIDGKLKRGLIWMGASLGASSFC